MIGILLLDAGLVLLAASLLVALYRVLAGPTEADRGLAVDYGFVVVVAFVVLLALRLDSAAMLDLVVVATLVGFLATVAFARLIWANA
ncbi:monovalent cation/H+ antiporter complex subunit F [Pseudonocardia nematodicida]|uniref:Monovalent cation/H+ antiporter complex subunit F n=1 Tax=Pseudonocardia nematodicida TaxID=1206997 RepID=A0ABV1KK00_9PSEU